MKSLLPILFAFQILYADSPAPEEKTTEEVALLEDDSFTEKFIPPQRVEQPLQKFKIPEKKSSIAVGLSLLTPGLGSIYLGEYQTGRAILGTTIASIGYFINDPHKPDGLIIAQNTWGYGIYAAYRDARIYNKSKGYSYPMPTDSFSDLALAPFRLRVLKKPEVWGGLVGMFTAGALLARYAFRNYQTNGKSAYAATDSPKKSPFLAFPIGIGEETFFRGYLQPALSENLTPAGGIIASSILFSLAHIGNADRLPLEQRWQYYAFSMPYIAVAGSYFGWITYKNNSLQESVALHSWYDFILFSAAAVAVDTAILKESKFAFAISF